MEFMNTVEINSLKKRILRGELPDISSIIHDRHRGIFETVCEISSEKLDEILNDRDINYFPFKKTLPVSNINKILRKFSAWKNNFVSEENFSHFIFNSFIDHRTNKNVSKSKLQNDEYEFEASSLLKEKLGKLYDVKYCGRCVSPKFPLISCRPDSFVTRDGFINSLVEIKTPKILHNLSVNQWLRTSNNFNDFKIRNNEIVILKETPVYDQIQMSLAICNLYQCELIYFSPKYFEILHLVVTRDDKYIEKKCELISQLFNQEIFDFFKSNLKVY